MSRSTQRVVALPAPTRITAAVAADGSETATARQAMAGASPRPRPKGTVAAPGSAGRDLGQQRAVAVERDAPVGRFRHVGPAAPAHLFEVVLAAVELAQRRRKQVRAPRWDHEPTARLLDDARGLALGVGGDDDGAADGEDPVEAARDDVAGKAALEPDEVHVRRRQRLGEQLARLIRQE